MRCTNKNNKSVFHKRRGRRRNRRANFRKLLCLAIAISALCIIGICFVYTKDSVVVSHEDARYAKSIKYFDLPLDEFCVATEDVTHEAFAVDGDVHALGLFDLSDANVIVSQDIHERLYPASTTKLLTAYLALKYGNLEDTITISEQANGVPLDSSRAGLRVGDQVTLETLLYGLMLPSGNDSAVAIAEYISGSESAFSNLMNEEAKKLGATNSNFVNAHGYHDENHYTTAYDLYLITKECLKNDTLVDIISQRAYNARITQKNGTYREVTWNQTNRYITGDAVAPANVMVIGGKTGTTDEAGACLVLCEETGEQERYISIVMGADNKTKLYHNMTELMSLITN